MRQEHIDFVDVLGDCCRCRRSVCRCRRGCRTPIAATSRSDADPSHQSVGWDLGSLRTVWNRAKHSVAPWWADNSKEAYSSGLADLARALDNWKGSTNGNRDGRRVGFPRFKSARRDRGRVRFTTGTMRLEPDRRTIVLPVIGIACCHGPAILAVSAPSSTRTRLGTRSIGAIGEASFLGMLAAS